MLRQRTAAITVAAVGLVLAVAGPASADRYGDTECDPTKSSCEVSAGLEETEPASPGGAPAGGGDDTASGGGGGEDGPLAGWDCTFKIQEFEPDSDIDPQYGERPSSEHQLLVKTCTDPETGTNIQTTEWVGPGEGETPIDPAVLAQEAIDQLRLPAPQIEASPSDYQLVRLPTWLFLAGDSWSTQEASASVPGLTVTATARPVQATWDMGDGSTVVCESAGTKWTPMYSAEDASPDCGHTYTRSSAQQPDGTYTVSVVVAWEVSWSGGGESGTEPGMTTTAQVAWPVAESQAIGK